MNRTNSKTDNSELSAMNAWAKLVDAGKAPHYVPTAVPVADRSSQQMPKTMSIEAAIRNGFIHN